jgi:hypothetical protein
MVATKAAAMATTVRTTKEPPEWSQCGKYECIETATRRDRDFGTLGSEPKKEGKGSHRGGHDPEKK